MSLKKLKLIISFAGLKIIVFEKRNLQKVITFLPRCIQSKDMKLKAHQEKKRARIKARIILSDSGILS